MTHVDTRHVTVELLNDFKFAIRFEDVAGKPTLICDEPEPLGGGDGPNPAALLAAAVGNCLAASLVFCLRKARLELVGLTARVSTHIARNEKGRLRISGIDVGLCPEIGGAAASQQRCLELFEDFCTVTASIKHGIPVTVSLDNEARSAA